MNEYLIKKSLQVVKCVKKSLKKKEHFRIATLKENTREHELRLQSRTSDSL
jgi:hypothetical protein